MLKPVPMAKVAVVGPKEKMAATIETLHRLNLLHIEDYTAEDDFFDLGSPLPEGSKVSERLVRVRGVMKGAGLSAPSESKVFTLDNLRALEDKLREVEDELVQLVESREKARDEAKTLEEQRQALSRVANLAVPTKLLTGYRSLATATGFVAAEADLGALRSVSPDVDTIESMEAEGRFVAVFAPKAAERALQEALGRLAFQPAEIPALDGTPKTEIARLGAQIESLHQEAARLDEKIGNIRERHGAAFFALDEYLSIEADKTTAPVRFRTTDHSFMVEGWIPAGEFARLEQALARATQNGVYTTRIQRASRTGTSHATGHAADDEHSEHHGGEHKEEVVPVMLKNPTATGPYELLTDTYSRPKYTELDPTLFMTIGFPFFFGMMLGDVGYGLVMLLMLGTGVFNALYKMFGFQSTRHLNRIFLHCALASILFGFLFSEFFGLELFGEHGIVSHFSTMIGPIPYPLSRLEYVKLLLALSLLIGVVHLFVGLIIGMRNAAAEHGIGDAIKHRGSWLAILLAVFLAGVAIVPDTLGLGDIGHEAATEEPAPGEVAVQQEAVEAEHHVVVSNPTPFYYAALLFFVVGVVLLVMGEGGIALLELPTVLSNLLSYTRLVAIGLSGVGIALAGNKVAAGLISGEILGLSYPVGLTVAIIVAVLFHTMGVLLGILGPALHALRLHYVEFFTKFYAGGGTAYSPFGAQRKYTKQEVKQA